jgi:hypothetical protein
MTEETLKDSDLDSLTFVASARIAKHQAGHRPSNNNLKGTQGNSLHMTLSQKKDIRM